MESSAASTKPLRKPKGPSFSLKARGLSAAVFMIAIALATALAYSNVLFNFFCGDDFVHLEWLGRTAQHPGLIWKNFYSNWLDVPTCKFYRPLISIFMVADYRVWGINGLGFHITNLLVHLLSTVFLYCCLIEVGTLTISRRADQQPDDVEPNALENDLHARGVVAWALFSSALFALYPLHAEPVSWITGRVDSIVTMFYLLALFCYLRWRQSVGHAWLVAALGAFTASLLSKEMSVTLPALLVVIEMLYPGKPKVNRKSFPARVTFVIGKSIEKSFSFWLFLLFYFIVRRIALGTFIGGYNSFDGLPPLRSLTHNWLQAGGLMLLPTNHDILSNQAPFSVGWLACLSAAIAFTLYVVATNPHVARVFLLLIAWLVLSLLPVLTVLNIDPNLRGSRFVYLASAAMSALLCLSSLQNRVPGNKWVDILQISNRIGLFALLFMSLIVLFTNNQAWQEAGNQTRSIIDGLKEISLQREGATASTYLVGLPDNIHGAYVARNALDGMSKPPVMADALKNYFSLDNFDHVYPFGFSRQSMSNKTNDKNARVAVYVWNKESRTFGTFPLTQSNEAAEQTWQGADLVHAFQMEESTAQIQTDSERGVVVTGVPKKRSMLAFQLDNLPCWTTEMLVFKIKTGKAKMNDGQDFFFNYTNTQVPALDPSFRVPSLLVPAEEGYNVVIPLHSEVSWAFGNQPNLVIFSAPENYNFTVAEIHTAKASEYLPMLSMQTTGNQNENGFVRLDSATPECQLDFDVTNEDGANGADLEVGKSSQFFQLHNSTTPEAKPLFTGSFKSTKGTITLNREDFPGEGLYEARISGIDAKGHRVGFASDHVLITVGR